MNDAAWLAHQRRRWMLPDPSRWLRPDHLKWVRPEPVWRLPAIYERKYDGQPRVPAGSPDGGQWADGGGGVFDGVQQGSDLDQSLVTAPDQASRSDLLQMQDIANDPAVHSKIDEAWQASNPTGASPQEHGFWISRDEATGKLFIRPFANRGFAASIVPGPKPDDAVAFFHTHPNSPVGGFIAGPSAGDIRFANEVGLPGLLQSHNGVYYFGPGLKPR